jgi:hypothetical protein
MSAPFMRVQTRSRTSLRFAKANLSSPRTCPWFGLTSVILKQSNSVSAPCAFPYRLFPVRFSARSQRCKLQRLFSAVASGPEDFAFSYPDQTGRLQTLTHKSFVGRFKTELGMDSAYRYGFCPVCRALVSPRGRHFRLPECGAQIKEQGDWKSSAYLLYLEFDDPARARVAALMAHSILLTTWRFPGHHPHWRQPPA